MKIEEALNVVIEELKKAEAKFPGWPPDVVYGAAIVGEEAGELIQAALDFRFGREASRGKMMKEAAQTAAMGLRFLTNLPEVEKEET